ncbi:unnamed protein product [Arabidopsis halleri]
MGICSPPSWNVPLPNDPSQILQLREPPQVFKDCRSFQFQTVSSPPPSPPP